MLTRRNSEDLARIERGAVAIVDPFSTGAFLAFEAAKAGYLVVCVLSERDSPFASFGSGDLKIEYAATIQHENLQEDQEAATKSVGYNK